jgi:hypothetical protein
MPGGGGGGTTSTTSTVNTGPWQNQQGPLQALFDSAGYLLNHNQIQPFQGSTVSPFTPAQTQGYQGVINQAQAGTPSIGSANTMLNNTINGQYLDPSTNPYLASTYNNAAKAVTDAYQTATAPQTASQFEMAGRYGSGAANQAQNQNQLALGRSLDSLASSIYGGNYQQERQNQLTAAGMAPTLDQAQYLDPTAMINAGGGQQQQNQAALTGNINQFYGNQMLPWQNVQMYQGLVGGNYGQSGTTTSQQPYYSNPFGSAIGGVTSLAGAAGNLGWKPFG